MDSFRISARTVSSKEYGLQYGSLVAGKKTGLLEDRIRPPQCLACEEALDQSKVSTMMTLHESFST
jgi:hypothetical protein